MIYGIPALLAIGIILGIITMFVPMEPTVSNLVRIAAIICTVIGIAQLVLPALHG